MTRVRLDPSFVEDERWERLGPDALVLHMTALSYVTRTLSDGLLSSARVRVLTPLVTDPEAVGERLIADGLWERLDDGQVRVCQVRDDLRFSDGRGDEQPSSEFVLRERERVRKAKEAWRSKRNGERNAVPSDVRNGAQSNPVQSSAVQDPKGPGPALHDASPAQPAAVVDACADVLCDGTGWREQPGQSVRKCADHAWHSSKEATAVEKARVDRLRRERERQAS